MSTNHEFQQTKDELEKTLIPFLLKGPPPPQIKIQKEKKQKKKEAKLSAVATVNHDQPLASLFKDNKHSKSAPSSPLDIFRNSRNSKSNSETETKTKTLTLSGEIRCKDEEMYIKPTRSKSLSMSTPKSASMEVDDKKDSAASVEKKEEVKPSQKKDDKKKENKPSQEKKKKVFKQYFKVPLGDILEREDRESIPILVEKCVQFILQNGLDVEGVFRVSPNFSDFQAICKLFDDGADVELDKTVDVHVVCGVLKKFLRELPAPILTYETYSCFLAITGLRDKSSELCQESIELPKIKSILSMLPASNRALSLYIIDFLGKVAEHENENKMTIQNLATVFGPLLVRSDEKGTDLVSESSTVNSVVEILVSYRSKINA